MYNYSIMPLDKEHIKEICEDIRQQYKQGICSLALFSIPLVPEGNPPVDKAKIACEVYDLFRDELAKTGHECGILAQCTIGHGYSLDNMFEFQQYTSISSGDKTFVVCPYDEEFREYIKNAMNTLASHNPKIIMVDDDFRLLSKGYDMGCACPLHMAEFNKRAGTDITREELFEIVKDTSKEENRRLKKIFEDTQRDSLIGAAKAMREGIDAVNPKMQGVFCTCENDPAGEITKTLAGEGNPSIMRINNGSYTAPGARNVSKNMHRAAKQMAFLYNKVDVYLAETDTCPHNRYSTSAQFLHNHFSASILEGVKGAKHWITRLVDYEPNSGKAYREILGKNKGFYETLIKLVPKLEWVGCKIPLPLHTSFNFMHPYDYAEEGWGSCVLERLGLPMYFSAKEGGVVFLDGNYDNDFTNEEIKKFFKSTLVLSSSAALSLIERGFGKLMGVEIREWNGRNISGERLNINNKCCAKQMEAKELVITSQNTTADSFAYHIPDGQTKEIMFPASTIHKNELGGTTIVFCGTPNTEFAYYSAFSFLNESRKLQLINMLRTENKLPVYYPEDAEVYLKAAYTEDGDLFCGFFNIGLDPLNEIPLTTDFAIKKIQILSNDGTWEDVNYKKDVNTYRIEKSAGILDPVMIMLKKAI